jgi:pimeloyl-ACP methyl ester carboxylesterase
LLADAMQTQRDLDKEVRVNDNARASGRRIPSTSSQIDVPTLIVYGDGQIVPIAASARKTVQLVNGAVLTVYPDAPHGFPMLPGYKEQLNADMLAFLQA